jgi:hypothetical protein
MRTLSPEEGSFPPQVEGSDHRPERAVRVFARAAAEVEGRKGSMVTIRSRSAVRLDRDKWFLFPRWLESSLSTYVEGF